MTPIRQLRAMQLRRLVPLAKGRQRGEPIVRYYWRLFLDDHVADLHGRGLEIGESATLRRFGGTRINHIDTLDVAPRSGVTIVADLSRADPLAPDQYDCFVVPFTTHLIFDIEAALYHAVRILKPGGVLLINFPCIEYDFANGLDMGTGRPLFVFWLFSPLQVHNLLRRLGLSDVDYTLRTDGNLFARVAYQVNMPAEELTRHERSFKDPGHPLLVSVRVIKPQEWHADRPEYREPWMPSTIPAEWNPETGHYPRR